MYWAFFYICCITTHSVLFLSLIFLTKTVFWLGSFFLFLTSHFHFSLYIYIYIYMASWKTALAKMIWMTSHCSCCSFSLFCSLMLTKGQCIIQPDICIMARVIKMMLNSSNCLREKLGKKLLLHLIYQLCKSRHVPSSILFCTQA